jgi:hypothetical protein
MAFGYSIFRQQIEEIASELTVFVAPNDPVEIFQLTLTNHSAQLRQLDVTSYAEWLLGFAPDEHREFHKLFIETAADRAQPHGDRPQMPLGFCRRQGPPQQHQLALHRLHGRQRTAAVV